MEPQSDTASGAGPKRPLVSVGSLEGVRSDFKRWSEAIELGGFILAAAIAFAVGGLKYDLVGWFYTHFAGQPAPPLHRSLFGSICLALAFFSLAITRSARLARVVRAHERARQDAEALARIDALTGLANRRSFSEELVRALGRAERSGGACAVLLLDLDRFKPVNDLHGHAVGDLVLQQIARQLDAVMRKPESLARIGGDEFAVIVEYPKGGDAPGRLAKRLITAAQAAIDLGSTAVQIGATIGVAVYPTDAKDVSELLRTADIALYRAKREARGGFRCFEEAMESEIRTRASLESELKGAIADGQITPFFQPFVNLKTGELSGYEVLSRWRHPTRGLLYPDSFIPLVEEAGLSGELTYAVVRAACGVAKAWPAELAIAVNVSPQQLKDKWLAQRLLALLTETGFSPRRLEIEITENSLVEQMESARATLASLKNLGVKISLDDFGTGYSNLSHLRELSIDKVKIDKSFVMTMNTDPERAKIVAAIVNLAKSLGLAITAEGVEDEVALRTRAAMGCDFGQGYYFAKPLPAETAAELWRGAAARSRREPSIGALFSSPLRKAG